MNEAIEKIRLIVVDAIVNLTEKEQYVLAERLEHFTHQIRRRLS